MAFRQMARRPAVFEVEWPQQYQIVPWTENSTDDIARFLLSTGTQSFTEVSECADGTPKSARRYVTRAREYVAKELSGDEAGYAASSLVYDKTTGTLIAVCLCCGSSVYCLEVHPDHQRRRIATRMLQHMLTVHAQYGSAEVDLWRAGDSPGAELYKRLGFELTGNVE